MDYFSNFLLRLYVYIVIECRQVDKDYIAPASVGVGTFNELYVFGTGSQSMSNGSLIAASCGVDELKAD